MRGLLLFSALAATMRLSSCPLPEPPDGGVVVDFEDGFEDGLVGWTIDADVPDDPNDPGNPVAFAIEASGDQAFEGEQSAKFYLDGRQDDGTIWLARSFRVDPNRRYRVELDFSFWSETVSDANTLAKVAMYAGVERPRREEDFNVDQAANLAAGWKQYTRTINLTSDANGRIWVAFGISAVWETEMTYFIDDVRVRVEER